ncbi:hypothetical protein [Streptomyces uncialis]|uniref:Gram-positive cocci surface proteins LPxTG domain-containing protein n=1 Tax=Streptomyces uncialis TaxID=1048205 RepID=A0A1Q4V9T4_9ACTN|nr:hypothetical protein [Streptomyces uncialis]OKH94596.1 hypothetical protein AB852_10110 [Streptomyces uncialis]WTE14793.1 hypothetical protein OG924_33920 [Streptomyces uncialis]
MPWMDSRRVRIRDTLVVAGAALLPVLVGTSTATAADGASAAVTPSVVAPGGSFTLIVDCSAVDDPAPRTGNSEGLAAPLTLTPAGGGRFQAAGRLSRDLAGATAVGVDGDCGGPDSRWIASMLVSTTATTGTASPTPSPVPSAGATAGATATVTRAPGTSRSTAPPASGGATVGGVRGGLGGTFGGHPTPSEVTVGVGLLVAGVVGAGLVIRRRTRAGRH